MYLKEQKVRTILEEKFQRISKEHANLSTKCQEHLKELNDLKAKSKEKIEDESRILEVEIKNLSEFQADHSELDSLKNVLQMATVRYPGKGTAQDEKSSGTDIEARLKVQLQNEQKLRIESEEKCRKRMREVEELLEKQRVLEQQLEKFKTVDVEDPLEIEDKVKIEKVECDEIIDIQKLL